MLNLIHNHYKVFIYLTSYMPWTVGGHGRWASCQQKQLYLFISSSRIYFCMWMSNFRAYAHTWLHVSMDMFIVLHKFCVATDLHKYVLTYYCHTTLLNEKPFINSCQQAVYLSCKEERWAWSASYQQKQQCLFLPTTRIYFCTWMANFRTK